MNYKNRSYIRYLMTTCMALGVMISPVSFVIFGNGLGVMGYFLLWILPLSAVINFWSTYLYGLFPHGQSPGERTSGSLFRPETIFTPLKLSFIIPFVIGVSTLILATAGYAFNEIFMYWFPNLLFSLVFLVFILTLNLIGPSVAGFFQSLSVITFVGSMVLLVTMGFFNWDKPDMGPHHGMDTAKIDWRTILMAFWIFMAAELAVFHERKFQIHQSNTYFLMAAFIVAFTIFWFWGLISLHFVPTERLTDSTVPHSIVARAVSGENGRKIMGVAIISGSFASVNTLMAGGSATLAIMTRSVQLFPFLNRKIFGGNAAMMIFSIGILFMLLTGMAGKDITGIISLSAFYIWLLSNAAFNGLVFWNMYNDREAKNRWLMPPAILAALVHILAAVVLIATDPDFSAAIAWICGFILLSVLALNYGRHDINELE